MEKPYSRQQEEQFGRDALLVGTFFVTLSTAATMNIANYLHKSEDENLPKDPKGEFRVLDIEGSTVTLEQDGKKFTITDEALSEEVKLKVSKENPSLKPFLDSLDKDGVKVITPEKE